MMEFEAALYNLAEYQHSSNTRQQSQTSQVTLLFRMPLNALLTWTFAARLISESRRQFFFRQKRMVHIASY